MTRRQLELPLLLVAMPHLQDPYFKKSVVLLVEHNEEGAIGFIVNRLGKVSLQEILEVENIDVPLGLKAWFGGPVDPGSGVILAHSLTEEGSIAEGVTLATTDDVLNDLIETSRPFEGRGHATILHQYPGKPVIHPYRFLVGYAGWEPGQLDEEIRTGYWIQLGLDRELLFNASHDTMWDRAIASLGIQATGLASTHQPYLN